MCDGAHDVNNHIIFPSFLLLFGSRGREYRRSEEARLRRKAKGLLKKAAHITAARMATTEKNPPAAQQGPTGSRSKEAARLCKKATSILADKKASGQIKPSSPMPCSPTGPSTTVRPDGPRTSSIPPAASTNEAESQNIRRPAVVKVKQQRPSPPTNVWRLIPITK